MVYTSSHFSSILPDPVLNILRPGRLELLLTDRAWGVAERGIVRGPDPGFGGLLLGIAIYAFGTFGSLRIQSTVVIARFARFDPVLSRVRKILWYI
jgi:hypothetical protein